MKWLLDVVAVATPYAEWITLTGVVVIVVVSLLRRGKIHASEIAGFATTTGILFTFVGIVIALGGLGNSGGQADIQEKLDALLSGIFIAFVPSIFGAGIAVWTHVGPNFWRKPIDEYDEQETDVDAQILQELKRLNTNIVGDSEISLTTRLGKFQRKVTDNQDELRREFQEFAENVADKIIMALQQSMDDLNEKLGTQFGENFGRFADVIPKLLEWQEQYRETIQNTQDQLNTQSKNLQSLLDSIEGARKSFIDISEHTEKIAAGSAGLDDSMKNITTSLTESAQGIDKMSAGVEQMKMDATQFQKAAASLTTIVEKQKELAEKQTESLEESAASLTAISEKAAMLNETAERLDEHIEAMNAALGGIDRLSDSLQGKAESITENMKSITDTALTELANNLRGISEALVNDYQTVQIAIAKIKKIAGEKS